MRKYLREISVIIIFTLFLVGMGWFGAGVAGASAMAPRIFFTDITSGPNTGGKDNNGAFLTIYGKGFGTVRGTSTVTVGGGEVCDYISWNSISWSDTMDSMLDIIEVQLGSATSTGDVVVTTADGASNSVPFTITSGNIYFVDHNTGSDDNDGLTPETAWKTLLKTKQNVIPGDIVYIREGEYTELDPHWNNSNLIFEDYMSGEEGLPIAYVGYPEEEPVIKNLSARWGFYFVYSTGYVTVAKLSFVTPSYSIYFSSGGPTLGPSYEGIRIVNNEVISGMSGIAVRRSYDLKVLGNYVHDSGSPGEEKDHSIYYGGYGPGGNVEIAWNTCVRQIHGRGIQIYGHAAGESLIGISIHDNVIYNPEYEGMVVGGSDAYQPWVKDALIYNNIIYNTSLNGGIHTNDPECNYKILNNTIYNSKPASIRIRQAGSVELKNNIFCSTGEDYFMIDDPSALITASNNCYYGKGNGPGWDTAPINADPQFVDLANKNFHISEESPVIDKGVVLSEVPKDHDGVPRPQGSGYDIGAYEYPSQPPTLRGDVNKDGSVNVVDVQLAVNQFLGVLPQTQEADLNGDGVVNVLDVQLLVNIILSLAT